LVFYGAKIQFLALRETGVIEATMTIPEIAAQLRVVLGICSNFVDWMAHLENNTAPPGNN
jgi:hypothetical protein